MSKIILDSQLRAKLNGLNETLEVCDETGQTVGLFLPAEAYRKLLYKVAESQCPYSTKELEAMRQEKGGGSLEALWSRLGVS